MCIIIRPDTSASMNLDDFFVRALLAGVGIAVVAAPLGCFIVWRRMAYFGDAMAHSALVGVALGLVLGIQSVFGVVLAVGGLALLFVALERKPWISSDTGLGILAHGSLALGLVALSLSRDGVNYSVWLFGDILAVSRQELLYIYGCGGFLLLVLALVWRPLLAATAHQDLAQAEGVPVMRLRAVLIGLIALTIALAMQLVGVLLTTSLLIIPAATARRYARTPEMMALLAVAIGAAAAVLGLYGSLWWDIPSGPAIVLAAAGMFALSLLPAWK